MIDWQQIDTVLLDMDGTLLDLHFDNFFWLKHLPRRYAEIHRLDEATAAAHLHELIHRRRGTLEWYCLEHWSEALSVDVCKLKEEIKDKIQIRPHVEHFLTRLRQLGKKRVLITNAHPQSLSLKLDVTAIDRWLDFVISSHEFKEPKETQGFWHALHARETFDPARTLFIDDTTSVLQSAKTYGLGHLLCIHQPDSQTHRTVKDYPAIHHFDEIMPPEKLCVEALVG